MIYKTERCFDYSSNSVWPLYTATTSQKLNIQLMDDDPKHMVEASQYKEF